MSLRTSDQPWCQLYLVFPDDPLVILHAPSSVESPPIAGAGMAILQIFDFGLKGNADQVQFSRAVAAHAARPPLSSVSLADRHWPRAKRRASGCVVSRARQLPVPLQCEHRPA